MEYFPSSATIKSRYSRPNEPSQTLEMSASMVPSRVFVVQSIETFMTPANDNVFH